MHQHAVGLLVQRSGLPQRRQQAVGEVAVEVARVDHEAGVRLEQLDARRLLPGAAIHQVALDPVHREQSHPFVTLSRVGRDLRQEGIRDAIQGDAPVRLQHQLLLEPELLLKVLQVGQEVDDLAPDATHRPDPRQRPVQPRRVALVQIIRVEHFAVHVQIQLAAQEAAQVLVDEVVEAVAGSVAREVAGQQGAVAVGFRRCRRRQQEPPVRGDRAQNPVACRGVDPLLLAVAVARPALLFAVDQRAVLEPHHQLAFFHRHRRPPAGPAGKDEAPQPAGGRPDGIRFAVGRGDLEAYPPRRLAGARGERVAGVILGGLDVVLVGVGPVQLHFFAIVGNQVRGASAAHVAALRHEVALRVISGEEAGQVIVDLGFGGRVLAQLGNAALQLDDRRRSVGVRVDA